MKTSLSVAMMTASCLALAACGGDTADESETDAAPDEATVEVDGGDSDGEEGGEELERASHNAPADGSATRPRPEEDPAIGDDPAMDALEGKCFAEVEKVTGASVTATLSKDFSQAGTMFRFRVDGAEAPWQCIGYSNGTIGGVMYTGDEGAM